MVYGDPNSTSRQGVNLPRTKIFFQLLQGDYYVDINLNTLIVLPSPARATVPTFLLSPYILVHPMLLLLPMDIITLIINLILLIILVSLRTKIFHCGSILLVIWVTIVFALYQNIFYLLILLQAGGLTVELYKPKYRVFWFR